MPRRIPGHPAQICEREGSGGRIEPGAHQPVLGEQRLDLVGDEGLEHLLEWHAVPRAARHLNLTQIKGFWHDFVRGGI